VRLAWLVTTLFVMSVLVFAATQALPGDPAQAILGMTATPERLAILRRQLGLDRPVLEQYTTWLGGIVRGDFGKSAVADSSVWSIIGARVTNSIFLMLVVTAVAVPISVGLALASANRHGGLLDRASNMVSIVLSALPEFVVGITMVLLFATGVFQWFPAVSIVFDSTSVVGSPDVIVLPALTLTLLVVPYLFRLVRASAVEVIESEYVRAAQLRGVRGWRLLVRHALPNVAPPMLQAMVLTTVYLIGGAVIVETVFSFPGMGLALVEAVRLRDLPTIQALVLIIATIYLVLTAVADVLTIALTPKMRTGRR
jgi:peptide/nickel transport system permease protein